MGIQVLYPVGEDANNIDIELSLNLDIVAIHGLNGNPLNTWTEPKSQKLWYRDFLPNDVPNARIMTFGYDATAAFERSTAGILEHARDLLRCLEEARTDEQERNRPILFCAHSLGGLVLKQALLIAAEAELGQYTPIWKSTIGVLFFGTPHRGSSLASYGAQLARVPTALSLKPTPQLLQSLKSGNVLLGELNVRFRLIMDRKGESRKVVSFYETRTMVAWRSLVVEQESAVINPPESPASWETPIPVAANHRDMCRFSSTDNPAYRTAVQSIQRLKGHEVKESIKNEYFSVPPALSRAFTGRNDIRSAVRNGIISTNSQLQQEQSRYVLWGMGGSGKTQICLKIANDFKNRFWAVFFIDGSSISTIIEGFQSIVKILKIPVSPISSMLKESVKDYLATQSRWLLIIDNADDPRLDLSEFIPPCKESSVLITTRNPGAAKYATTGSSCVEMMNENDAVTLLLKVSGFEDILAAGDDVSKPQPKKRESALEVVTTLGFLALAIVQAGAVIWQGLVGLDGFCALYAQRKKELLESGHPKLETEQQRSVYTTWEISIKMIEEIKEQHSVLALDLLRVFAFMHFDAILEKTFEDAWQEAKRSKTDGHHFFTTRWSLTIPDEWDQLLMGKALGLLLSFSLISMDADRRISLHPLVHQWSLERMSQNEKQDAWVESVVTLTAAISRSPGSEGMKERKALLPHIDTCLKVYPLDLSNNSPQIDAHVRAALAFSVAYRQNNRVHDSIRLTKGCLDSVESNLPASQYYHTSTLKHYADDLRDLGRYDQSVAIWEKIVELNRRYRVDSETISCSFVSTAAAHTLVENHQKAIELCTATISEFQESLGNKNMAIMEASEVIGYAKSFMGQRKQALKHLERCLESRVQMNTTPPSLQELALVEHLVALYFGLKQYKKALLMGQRKIEIYNQIYGPDDRATEAAKVSYEETRFGSGIVNLRRRAKCIAIAEKAYNIARQDEGDPSINTLFSMEQLAHTYFDSGLIEKARVLQLQIVAHYAAKGGEARRDTVESMEYLRYIERYIRLRKAVYWWVPKKLREKDWVTAKLQK